MSYPSILDLQLASKQLVGIFIMIYVKKSLLGSIPKESICISSLGVGLGGFIANKGACGIRFRVEGLSSQTNDDTQTSPRSKRLSSSIITEKDRKEQRDSSTINTTSSSSKSQTFCFISAHLSAFDGSEAVQRRNWDFNQIHSKLKFNLPYREARIGKGQEKALIERNKLEIKLKREWEYQMNRLNQSEHLGMVHESFDQFKRHRIGREEKGEKVVAGEKEKEVEFEPEEVELGIDDHE